MLMRHSLRYSVVQSSMVELMAWAYGSECGFGTLYRKSKIFVEKKTNKYNLNIPNESLIIYMEEDAAVY